MTCDLWRDKIDAAADGELMAETQGGFDVHLRNCASCAAEIAARARLKTAVKRAALRQFTPGAEFRQKIEAQILPQKRGRRFAWIWAPAFGVAAVILIAGIWLALPSRNASSTALSEIVDFHVAALASANPLDVLSTDQHTVKPWFEGKLPFAVNLPDLTNTPFTLLGGRVAYLHQSPGAGLLFQFRKHRLSVFVFQDRAAWKNLGTQNKPEQQASFWVENFSVNGLRYFVVGDTSAENVSQLSELMRSAAAIE